MNRLELYIEFFETIKKLMWEYRQNELEGYEAQLGMASTFDEYFPWVSEITEEEINKKIVRVSDILGLIELEDEKDKKFAENVAKKVEERVPQLADEDFIDDQLTEEMWRNCQEDNAVASQLSDIVTVLDNINTAVREVAQQLNDRL